MTSASRSTATRTAASRWTQLGREVDGDQIMAICADTLVQQAEQAARRRLRGDGDVQHWFT